MSSVRSVLTSVVGVLCAALLLSACGGTSTAEDSASGDFETVRIKHALGTAEITEKPERVVTLGQGSAETAIALGVTPVGIESYPWGADDTGYLPWIHEAVTERGDELPKQFTGGTELDIEAILELEPDLILAPWSGVTQEQYDLLSDIAPTVAYEKEPWVITWEDQIATIGRSLGEEKAAAGLVDDIEEQFASAANPRYEGRTFSFIYTNGPGTLGVFYPGEQRVTFVSALGLEPALSEKELKDWEEPGTDSALIGLENADMLDDSDVIFTFYADEKSRKETESQPLYAGIPAVKKGALVAPTDQSFVTASSIITPLTVPWALERYQPMIDRALARAGA
ncbi:MAG: iron-siderophore ABC transporter substrate-binding protein [Propionibacteriales bacterium]|nr:iron-siderophore ABC transporter substrate-binding protein [Propionibacteriales bacterium]